MGLALHGKQIRGLRFSREGLSDAGALAFQAMFDDGTQGIVTMELPASTLRIVGVRGADGALRFSLQTSPGQSYVVESRTDLSAGGWVEVSGTAAVGNGAPMQVVLPITMSEQQQYYRVRRFP